MGNSINEYLQIMFVCGCINLAGEDHHSVMAMTGWGSLTLAVLTVLVMGGIMMYTADGNSLKEVSILKILVVHNNLL